MKKGLIITIIIIAVFTLLVLGYNFLFVYHFKYKSDVLYCNYGEECSGKDVIIKYRGKTITNYEITSNVDVNKIGEYKMTYKVGKKKRDRVVRVTDMKGPTIKLNGDNPLKLGYKKEYTDPGYEVEDNFDKDLNDKVIIDNKIDNSKLGEYEVTYIIKDSSDNETKVTRKVNVVDDEGPVIDIKRKVNSYAIKGSKLDINDFTATDNYDGDVTSKVKVEGSVDTNKVGIYKVKYTVSDSNNNESVLESTINVQKKNTKGIPVLMYHWFYDDTKGEKAGNVNSHNYISKTDFAKQMKYLKDNNFYFPDWKELEDYIDKKIDLPEKSVIVTDDDCKLVFFTIAMPVFQEYEVPVTSFCITSKTFWQKYQGEKYLDLQSHTENMHVRKCKTSWDGAVMCSTYNEINNDIKTSVDKLGGAYAFAYPFGHYNDNTIKALKANGIKLAFTINEGRVKRGANKYKLPRVRISRGYSISKYASLIN